MIIKVLKKHIKSGQKSSVEFCPVALALKQSGFYNPIVRFRMTSFFNNLGRYRSFRNPKLVQKFILDFDNSKSVKPFKFELPDMFIEL